MSICADDDDQPKLVDGVLLYPWEHLMLRLEHWGVIGRDSDRVRKGVNRSYGTHDCTLTMVSEKMAPFGEFCWMDEQAYDSPAVCSLCREPVPDEIVTLVRILNMSGGIDA